MGAGIIAALVPIRKPRAGLLVLGLLAAATQPGRGQTSRAASQPASRPAPDPAVAALLRRMQDQEAVARPLSFRIELTARLFAGAEPLELNGWLAWEGPDHLAASVTWKSEFGELFLHALRDGEGLRIRERTPFGDERVLRARPEELAHLFPAPAEAASQGLVRFAGSRLLTERAERLRWSLVGEAVVQGVPCLELLGTWTGPSDPASFLPDRAQLWIGRDDLVVRRLSEARQGEVVQRLELSEVRVGQPIAAARWEFQMPPDAVVVAIADEPEIRRRLQAVLTPGQSRPTGRKPSPASRPAGK